MARKAAAAGESRSGGEARPVTERRGRVLFGDIPAGTIEERPDGAVVFCYLPEYLARPDAEPVSLTLPRRDRRMQDSTARDSAYR